MSRRAILISSLGLTVAVTAAEAQRPSPPVEPGTRTAVACTVETLQALAPAGSTIRKATRVAAKGPLPDFCQVDGEVATPGNAVGLRLRLPATWNGKFYFHGVGGFGGSVEPSSAGANSPAPGLARGFAVASTDTGHQGGSQDGSWALDSHAKEIDFAYRGTHAATLAGKALTAAYYGAAPGRSYFVGCSNGGAQALMEAQRYPEDFDGIVAGAPSFRNYIGRTLAYQTMLASPDAYLPAAKLEAVSGAVLAACDAHDGLTDGLVSDPQGCSFDPQTLLCAEGDGPHCLTRGQVSTLEKLYRGFTTRDGTRVVQGFPVGHEAGPSGWQRWIVGDSPPERRPDGTLRFTINPPSGFTYQDQFFRYLAFETDDPEYDWRRFDVDRDGSTLDFMHRILRPLDADLRPFQSRGGKLLLYHGWADPALSANATIEYFDRTRAAVGGPSAADSFMRLFLAPGMHHCGGGPGPNSFVEEAVAALEAWVEKGTPPATIVATHADQKGAVDRSRPLCPHPQVARYRGTGSIDEAASFVCATP